MTARSWVCCLLVVIMSSQIMAHSRIKPNPLNKKLSQPETRVIINDREYLFSTFTSYTWSESLARCNEVGMTLVNLETTEEHDAIFNYIQTGAVEDVWRWTGGKRNTTTGQWIWGNNQIYTDLNWGPGQPSTAPEVNAVTNFLVSFGGWDDDDGELWYMSYVCEQLD